MQPTQSLTPAQQFFFEHAGYSYTPDETREQGRTRCAIRLAAAEARYLQAHRDAGVRIEWLDDDEGAAELRHDGQAFATCEGARLVSADGAHLASLWSITDADSNYRRVVRAELAAQAFPA